MASGGGFLYPVLRQLFALRSLQELLYAVAGSVGRALGGEHDVHARDVVARGERLGRAGTLRGDADLERTEAVQLTMCTTSTSISTTVYW